MSFFQAPIVGVLKDRQYTGEVFSAGSLTNEQLATITSSQITSTQKDFTPSIWSLNAGQNPGSPQRLNQQSSLRRGGHRRAYSDGPWAISAVWPPADEFSALGANFDNGLQGEDGFSHPSATGGKMGWSSSTMLRQTAELNRGDGAAPGSSALGVTNAQNAHSRSEGNLAGSAQLASKASRNEPGKPGSPGQQTSQQKLSASLSARLGMLPIQEAGPQMDSAGQSSCNTSCADMQDAPPGVDSDDLMMMNSLEVPDFGEFGLPDDLGLGDQECKWQDGVLDDPSGDQFATSEKRKDQRGVRRSNSSCTRRDIALLDPKVFKRMMANRESAARSKAKKTAMLNTLKEKVGYYQQDQARLEDERKALLDDSTVLSRYRMDMSSQAAGLEFQLTNAQMGTSELRSQLMNLQRSMDLPLIEPSVPEDDILELPPLPELHSSLFPRYSSHQNMQRRHMMDGAATASTPGRIDSDHCMQRRMSMENPFPSTPYPNNGNSMLQSPFDTPSATSSSRTTPGGTEPATPRGFNSPPFMNPSTSQAQVMQTLQGLATRRRSTSMESMLSSAQQQQLSLGMDSQQQHFSHHTGSHRKLASWDSILAGPNGGLDGLTGGSRGPERALSTGASWDAMLSTPGGDARHVVTSGADISRAPHIGSAPRFGSSHSLPMADHNMESDVWHPQWHSNSGRGADQALAVAHL